MTFDVTTHPLLSASARALLAADADAFEAQADAAELVLRITAADLKIESEADLTALLGDKADNVRAQARLAVVRQMARDLANPADQNGLSSERRGEREVSYFAGRYDKDRPLDAQATLLADAVRLAVLGDGTAAAEDESPWAVARTMR